MTTRLPLAALVLAWVTYAVDVLMHTPSLPIVYAGTTLQNPIAEAHLYCFLHDILGAFILIVFPVIVLMLVYSGFLFVTAQGNSTQIADAKKWFFWVVVGGLIILGAQVLTWAIERTVNDIMQGSGVGTPFDTGRQVCG